ncbi:MAG: hypothetical protein QOI11_1828, partial [Candidatus Eremiobacteraeota bacterium]|nr:hypothetical protein [Candidatus Eremiobacteraeota bacterium]
GDQRATAQANKAATAVAASSVGAVVGARVPVAAAKAKQTKTAGKQIGAAVGSKVAAASGPSKKSTATQTPPRKPTSKRK